MWSIMMIKDSVIESNESNEDENPIEFNMEYIQARLKIMKKVKEVVREQCPQVF